MGSVVKITLDAETFKALASSTRLTVMRALDERRKTLSELARDLELNKATVHEHLQLLTAAELVKKRDDEGRKWIYYELTWRGQKILHPQETTTFNVLLGISVAAAGGGLGMLALAVRRWSDERAMATPEGAAMEPSEAALNGAEAGLPDGRLLALQNSQDGDRSETSSAESATMSAAPGTTGTGTATATGASGSQSPPMGGSGGGGGAGGAPPASGSGTYSASGTGPPAPASGSGTSTASSTYNAYGTQSATTAPGTWQESGTQGGDSFGGTGNATPLAADQRGAFAGLRAGKSDVESDAVLESQAEGGSSTTAASESFILDDDGWLGLALVGLGLLATLLSALLWRRLRPAKFTPPQELQTFEADSGLQGDTPPVAAPSEAATGSTGTSAASTGEQPSGSSGDAGQDKQGPPPG